MLLESPLHQGVGDAPSLIRERADHVDVLHLAIRADEDPDWNGVELALIRGRVGLAHQILWAGVAFDALRCVCAVGHLHFVEITDQALQELRIAAGIGQRDAVMHEATLHIGLFALLVGLAEQQRKLRRDLDRARIAAE